MSFEGTTNPVVEETVVSTAPEVEVNDAPEALETESPEVDENGEEVSPPAPVDDTEEVEFEGNKVRVPKAVKDALLRHADYTQKTQQLAEQRRAFEASRLGAESVNKEYVDALAEVKAVDARLKFYENVDWATLEATDPASAQSHWRTFSQLKDARTAAEKSAEGKKQSLDMEAKRARANRAQEATAELIKLLPDAATLAPTLEKYGLANKLSLDDMDEFVVRNPNVAVLLNKARLWDAQQTKDANTKRIAAAQAVKPAAEIGSRSATATRDPARMSQAAYVKWREAQG